MESEAIQSLIKKSREAMAFAHCPYSKFQVGAALITEDSTVFTGCNVENASYGLTICAERTALVKAVSEGHTEFKAMAISTNMPDTFSAPCGACRQFLLEFGLDYEIYLTKPDLSYVTKTPIELLPLGFTPKTLTAQQDMQKRDEEKM